MIPRGLPVGTAVKGLDGIWRVRLGADESSIDFVRILLFTDFSRLVDQKELSQNPIPPVRQALGAQQAVTTPTVAPAAAPKPAAPKPAGPPAAASAPDAAGGVNP
jgi:rod shape-determining protein MreC